MKKIVILCPYSYPSQCGIWSRVFEYSKALKDKGYKVHVYSSNIIKGTSDKSSDYEEYQGINIHRFKVLFSIGGSALFWVFLKKIRKINPDIIHTHGYRHPHSFFGF